MTFLPSPSTEFKLDASTLASVLIIFSTNLGSPSSLGRIISSPPSSLFSFNPSSIILSLNPTLTSRAITPLQCASSSSLRSLFLFATSISFFSNLRILSLLSLHVSPFLTLSVFPPSPSSRSLSDPMFELISGILLRLLPQLL